MNTQLYLKKSKDDKIYWQDGISITDGNNFAVYKVNGNKFVIIHLFAIHNGRIWIEKLREIAKANKCDKFIFYTKRNPRAFAKFTGAKIIAYVLEGDV